MGTITAQIQLTEAELKLLQTLVYQECGMFFDERRSHFLKDRLQRRLKACQLDSFYAYYRLLTSRDAFAEAAHPSALESRDRRLRHQLCQPPRRPGRPLHRAADGARRLHLPPSLFRKVCCQVCGQAIPERTRAV